MLHLEYSGVLGNFSVDIPEKIICIDEKYPWIYNKTLIFQVDFMFDEPVARITNWANYEWLWIDELVDLKYIDYERVKNIKAFL